MVKNLGFPPRLMTMRNDGKQKRKINVKAEMTVPHILGSVILKKVLISEAPRSLEACSPWSEEESRALVIREKATGKFRYTWARIMALKEYRI